MTLNTEIPREDNTTQEKEKTKSMDREIRNIIRDTLLARNPGGLCNLRDTKENCRICGYDRIAGKNTCGFCGATEAQRVTGKR
ncbi:MAG: hypothetical protein NUV49_01060 [Patescibacteria group bacterium]|nr:hypothetical protein [Patescibacteria group bacterium]